MKGQVKEVIKEVIPFGRILLRKNPRAKRLILRWTDRGALRVTVPPVISWKVVLRFLRSNESLILKKQEEIRRERNGSYTNGYVLPFGGFILHIEEGERFTGIIEGSDLRVQLPQGISIQSEEAQQHIAGIVHWAEREYALKRLPERTRQLAERYGFMYGKVSIRQQKTRWGSCSSKNNLNLNARLVALPDKLRDYVILHELVHTRVKNHGPEFWDTLEKVCPRARQSAREMKRYPL